MSRRVIGSAIAMAPRDLKRPFISSKNTPTRSRADWRPKSSRWFSACWRLSVIIFRRFRTIAGSFFASRSRLWRFTRRTVVLMMASAVNRLAVSEAEDIAGQVERADLPATVTQQFVTPDRPLNNLIDIICGLCLSENLGVLHVPEFA